MASSVEAVTVIGISDEANVSTQVMCLTLEVVPSSMAQVSFHQGSCDCHAVGHSILKQLAH